MSDRDYCYPPDYTVLRNRLDIRDAAEERELVAQRLLEPVPTGDFDLAHLKAIHRHLFQDIYAWAGEVRTVELAKGESRFQPPRFIAAGMADIHRRIVAAECFRGSRPDGFAAGAGHAIDLTRIDRAAWLQIGPALRTTGCTERDQAHGVEQSRCHETLHRELSGAISGLPEVPGHLHTQPGLRRRAEGFRQPYRHFHRTPRSLVHELGQRLPRSAQPFGGPRYAEAQGLETSPLHDSVLRHLGCPSSCRPRHVS